MRLFCCNLEFKHSVVLFLTVLVLLFSIIDISYADKTFEARKVANTNKKIVISAADDVTNEESGSNTVKKPLEEKDSTGGERVVKIDRPVPTKVIAKPPQPGPSASDKRSVASEAIKRVLHKFHKNAEIRSRDINKKLDMSLAESPECASDVTRYCSESVIKGNNFAVMDCLQKDDKTAERVTYKCQHLIWTFKHNLTRNFRFDTAANGACKKDYDRLTECNSLPTGSGYRIACLVENLRTVEDENCKSLLRRLEPIIFSDYRMIGNFAKACQSDIEKMRCGRFGQGPAEEKKEIEEAQPRSQGGTIACLSRNVDELQPQCQKQILRLAELQSDDYHYDRPLFYACREDREQFCAQETSGNGRIFNCLVKHKKAATMSANCRTEIVRVQKLVNKDYKVERVFEDKCMEDIKRHDCLPSSEEETDADKDPKNGIVRVIFCLEKAIKMNGRKSVSSSCQSEMLRIRSEYLADDSINTQLYKICGSVIKKFCQNEQDHVHCLMTLYSRNGYRDEEGVQCKEALQALVRMANPMQDLRVDPIIYEACQPVIQHECRNFKASGFDNVYVCLKGLVKTRQLPADCDARMKELEYFENRDFKLNDKLYQACKSDAKRLCGVDDDWYIAERKDGFQKAAAAYHCLFKHMHINIDDDGSDEAVQDPAQALGKKCKQQLYYSLSERAARIEFNPELYRPCLADLSKHCMKGSEKGEEFSCLQDHMKELETECRKAVVAMTKLSDTNILLSPEASMVKACMPFVEKHCGADQVDPTARRGVIMKCLIENKADPDMDPKCRAGVEHHQLISLQDYTFTYKFAQACKSDVRTNCGAMSRTKAEVIRCLSEFVRNNTIYDQPQVISKACRNQLRFELLQRSHDIKLDPNLEEKCRDDVQKLCTNSEEDAVSCLKNHRSQLSEDCHEKLFKREKFQMEMPTYDQKLMKRCKPMIEHFCADHSEPTEIFKCLKENVHDTSFSKKCRRIVFKRMAVQSLDFRLDPALNRFCKKDIKTHCKNEVMIVMKQRHEISNSSSTGIVVQCLRKVFVSSIQTRNIRLENSCHMYVRSLILEYNMNYRLDPQLVHNCQDEIKAHCSQEVENIGEEGEDIFLVTECLKKNLVNQKIQKTECKAEIVQLFREFSADIHVDPILHKLCSSELRSLCKEVPLGAGRQMSCLTSVLEDKHAAKYMSPTCRKALQERIDMMRQAMQLAGPETVKELLFQVSTSPSKNYFLAIFSIAIFLIFVIGLCAGRVTKRLKVDMKNK